jgi:hypothetical protein
MHGCAAWPQFGPATAHTARQASPRRAPPAAAHLYPKHAQRSPSQWMRRPRRRLAHPPAQPPTLCCTNAPRSAHSHHKTELSAPSLRQNRTTLWHCFHSLAHTGSNATVTHAPCPHSTTLRCRHHTDTAHLQPGRQVRHRAQLRPSEASQPHQDCVLGPAAAAAALFQGPRAYNVASSRGDAS